MSEQEPKDHLLAGYLEEHEMARQRKVSVQTQRKDRKAGRSSPWVRIGKTIYYPIELAKQHYAAQVVYPPASPVKPARPQPRVRPERARRHAGAHA
jgi:hypothetical protein